MALAIVTRVMVLQNRSRRFTSRLGRCELEAHNAGADAVPINRRLLMNALNHVILDQKDDIAVAIREVADSIDSSGSTDASVAFNEFLEELQQPQPRSPRLKMFWDGVFNALPSSAARDDAAAKIGRLF